MKYFVENKNGDVLGHDSVEQADLISGLDMSLYTSVITPPTQFETWDVATKSFVNDSNAEALHVSTQYQRDRVYPTMQEQLDMQYHDAVNGTTTWKDAITAEKTRIPKPV